MRTFAILIAIVLAGSPIASQQAARPSTEQLPPLSYVCTMAGDEDVIEDKPGTCRKCGMKLVPIRLDSVWTCATRPLLVVESKPGRCPVDGTPLVQVTAAVTWTCKSDPSVEKLEPGACADGTPMIKRYAARAHGNHNPQHGGMFFMAPDNWHHVEGAYLANGVFRLYLYDDFTKPLATDQVGQVTARIVTKQTFDPATRTTKEIAAVPLVRKGRYLEASIGKLPLPAQMTAKVAFKRGGAENVFDFAFEKFSVEPAAPRTTSATPPPATTTPAPSARPAASAAPPPTPAAPTPEPPLVEVASGADPALLPAPIPETVPEILAQLRTRNDQIRTLVDRGSFGSVYVPAFQAKDLALALEDHKDKVAPDRRKIAGPAIAQLVRSAYLLDAFGDLGNKQQILDAYALFAAAVKDIETSFPGR
jgi:heavy metal-binding protein